MRTTFLRANRAILWRATAGCAILAAACLGGLRYARGAKQGPTPQRTSAASATSAATLNSIGVAYMNQQRFADAQKHFERALAAGPSLTLARLNLGIALLSQQKSEEARAALERAAAERPQDPYAWYNLGIAYKDASEPEKALSAFQHVAKLAPDEPDAFYFIGYLYTQLQKYKEAIAVFQQALAIAPYHASAEFGLARAYQRSGDMAAARLHLKNFQKITSEHLGTPFGAGYGNQGKFSFAEYGANAEMRAPEAIAVRYAVKQLEAAPSSEAHRTSVGASTGACFFDFDGDGRPDLFLVSAVPGRPGRLLRNTGGGAFQDVTAKSGISFAENGLGCAAGDFDNDGKTDLAVCYASGVRLLRNTGGRFEDVTAAAGIRREPGCVGVTFVDYDHDGDLDLYVTAGPGAGTHNVLWRNNGNGTFTDVSVETALGMEGTGAGVVTSDFNNDRAIDFVIAGGKTGAGIYLNPREGKFKPLAGIDFAKENLPPAVGVVSFDFDKDGWMDLAFTHAGAPGISLWRNVNGQRLERVPLPDFGWVRGWGLAALDYDNDGWLDLVAAGETAAGGSELRLLRNLGSGKWSEETKAAHLDAVKLTQPRAIAVADVSGSGGADLIVTQLGGAPVYLRNEAASRNHWLNVDLKALNDNKSAIGTKVEVFAGPLYQKWEVQGASGYLGQNAPGIHAGLGAEPRADVVRLLWPTGVPQDEIEIAGGAVHSIAELDRRGSSCPVLFAWNGHGYDFIADMIGPGVVGHWVAPGERDVPDPTEYLKVPGRSLQPRGGLLHFRFMEPMEETVYLDQVRLLAIDHPAELEVYPNERFASAPPFPEFKVIASAHAHAPAGAWDDQGRDVLRTISTRDRKYVTDFPSLPFAGFAKLHWVELDLGHWDSARPLRLIIDGYTDYFTATSMYAADQAGIKVIAPYVEAQNAQGKWVRVIDDMGFPAGLERTMIADLTGKLPPGTRRIRIVTNLKIYWDAIRIDQTPEQTNVRVSDVPLAHAALSFLGYPKEKRLQPASDTVYSYAETSSTGPYTRAAGNYTRYGDVRELLRQADDRFVIFSSGEGVALDFDPANLPALPAGWTRDYFFYADGFEKDLDFYAAHAFTVGPLPHHGLVAYPYPAGQEYPSDAAHVGYELEYNTRERSGQMPADLQYHFHPRR